MKTWFTHNLALKIIALGLAIVTWIYVNGELKKQHSAFGQPSTLTP